MTPNEIMEQADRLRPNVYDAGTKLNWLCQAEGLIGLLVSGRVPEGCLRYPDDLETPLALEAPFAELYLLYLLAQMDLYDREYAAYNNSAAVFNAGLLRYQKQVLRQTAPQARGGFRL